MAAYASLSRRDPAVRAFLESQGIPAEATRLYIRDGAVQSITRAARNEQIVGHYHRLRRSGVRKFAGFDRLLAQLGLSLSRKQLGRIVADHERECGSCRVLPSLRVVSTDNDKSLATATVSAVAP